MSLMDLLQPVAPQVRGKTVRLLGPLPKTRRKPELRGQVTARVRAWRKAKRETDPAFKARERALLEAFVCRKRGPA